MAGTVGNVGRVRAGVDAGGRGTPRGETGFRLVAGVQPFWRIGRSFSGSVYRLTRTPNQGNTMFSDVRLPQETCFVGSGLNGLLAELSWWATTTIRVPLRTRRGSSIS